MTGGLGQGVLECMTWLSEYLINVQVLPQGSIHDIVEHGVMAWVGFNDLTDGRYLMCTEDRGDVGEWFLYCAQKCRDTRVVVRDQGGHVITGIEGFEGGQCCWGNSNALFVLPEMFEAMALDSKVFIEFPLKGVYNGATHVLNIQ